jgi:hypothetical protein
VEVWLLVERTDLNVDIDPEPAMLRHLDHGHNLALEQRAVKQARELARDRAYPATLPPSAEPSKRTRKR